VTKADKKYFVYTEFFHNYNSLSEADKQVAKPQLEKLKEQYLKNIQKRRFLSSLNPL